jgi:hypothetical protein
MIISFIAGFQTSQKLWLYIFKDYKKSRYRDEYKYDVLLCNTRKEAEDILDTLIKMLDEYKLITVADLCGVTGTESRFSDFKYGWTKLNENVTIRRNRHGYILDLGKPDWINQNVEGRQ